MRYQRPAHLFAADDGALYDTRQPGWHERPPLRPVYQRHFLEINSPAQFKATMRAGGHTFPGGYTLAFTTLDGCILCFDCAQKEARWILYSIRNDHRDGWHVDGITNADECEEPVYCDHCSHQLNSTEE